jgi:hypothetical protein
MSAVGKVPSRLPATPSKTISPLTGSGRPLGVYGEIARGRSKVTPPSNDRAMKMAFWKLIPPCQNTYSTPLLSVRSQQSWRPLPVMLLAAWVSCREVQVSPPSVDRATSIATGWALELRLRAWPRNAATQT